MSYVIFRRLDKKKLGITIKSSCDGNIEQRSVIAYAHDEDFCISGEKCEIRIQKIITCYNKMHEATGGKV